MKISYILLFISYLEVVLWTAALLGTLLAGSGVADGQQYIFRETSNLKFARQFAATPHIVVDFRGADLHKQLERAALQRLLEHFHAAGTSSAGTTAQPLNCPYSKRLSGIPAPFAGIDALD